MNLPMLAYEKLTRNGSFRVMIETARPAGSVNAVESAKELKELSDILSAASTRMLEAAVAILEASKAGAP